MFMATLKTTYTGDLRTEVVHIQSGEKLITDAPTDNRGKGEYFSPTDLLSASLGSCIFTTIGIATQTAGFSINGAEVETTKVMYDDPRRVGELILNFNFPENHFSDREKQIIENTAKNCPVTRSINPLIKLEFNFHF
jgi:putative redox protein